MNFVAIVSTVSNQTYLFCFIVLLDLDNFGNYLLSPLNVKHCSRKRSLTIFWVHKKVVYAGKKGIVKRRLKVYEIHIEEYFLRSTNVKEGAG